MNAADPAAPLPALPSAEEEVWRYSRIAELDLDAMRQVGVDEIAQERAARRHGGRRPERPPAPAPREQAAPEQPLGRELGLLR